MRVFPVTLLLVVALGPDLGGRPKDRTRFTTTPGPQVRPPSASNQFAPVQRSRMLIGRHFLCEF